MEPENVRLAEYEKLKEEQIARIGFRDNLLYVALGVIGALVAFSIKSEPHHYALLVVPWASLALGWNYLINDEKVSAIGWYIRTELQGADAPAVLRGQFGWEGFHRRDAHRKRRKLEQLVVDELTFVGSSLAALIAFSYLVPDRHWWIDVICVVELLITLLLGAEIIIYAQFHGED